MIKKRYILIILFFVVIAIVSVVIVQQRGLNTDDAITDRDTGERIEKASTGLVDTNPSLIVFGVKQLQKSGVSKENTDNITSLLKIYSQVKLNNKYESLTIRPQDTKMNNNVIVTAIRLGQTDIILPITIRVYNIGAKIFVNDPSNQYGGNYLGLSNLLYKNNFYELITIVKNADSIDSSIEINITANEGYRNAAIERIRLLGFNPAEFIITFKDYRNPFSS